ncbi:MAG: hypothetical protein IPK70_05245 [Flavobacteriales bacterium]|jgi:hypothetical protein|nr:hypothetical protein [Flavobacteriales bacterium]
MMAEASFTGTVKVILILLALWWVVRLIVRARAPLDAAGPRSAKRPVGDVRIEEVQKNERGRTPGGTIIDAEYEEIK